MSKHLLGIMCLMLVAIRPGFTHQGIAITNVTNHLQDTDYTLNIQIKYMFNQDILEALDNGVPLTINISIKVRRKGAWFWENNLVELTQKSLIRYYPLTEIYKVTRPPNNTKHSFITRTAAISALGEIEALPLLKYHQLKPGENYLLHIKISLDIGALPLPLRPTAHLSASWNLSSGWTQWPLKY